MQEETHLQQRVTARYRIVVADYEGGAIDSMVCKLAAAGVRADQTDLGEDAVELALARDYDMVIVASDLPDISSHEVVRRLRGAGWNAPIAVLTACSDPDWQAKLYALGIDGIIVQPWNANLMVAQVLAHLRRWTALGVRPNTVKDHTMARAIRNRDWRPGNEILT